jgi:SAM-dependent methyltransferase
MDANQKQRDYWNGPVGENWVKLQDTFDRGFTHITAALMDFAAAKRGENVLDIGCGAGTTTIALAGMVAPGRAAGIDISAPLVAEAKQRARAANSTAEFLEADASDRAFTPEFDLAFSRFGLMFFADPVPSFANIKRALKPGGRLAFVCWCRFEEIESIFAPYAAARDLFPPDPPSTPGAPGPFGLCDPDRTVSILTQAGYRGIEVQRRECLSPMGATVEDALQQAMNLGPLAFALRNSDDATKEAVRARIRPVLERYKTSEGIAPPAAFWLVGARA